MHNSVTERKVEPYSKLACIYDRLMSHVNYRQWSVFISKILEKIKIQSGSLLDISCGTGTLLENLNLSNFHLAGSDSSINMLKVAKKKVDFPLFCMDLAFYTTKQKFDVVLCLYDSINYITEENKFGNAIRNIYDILKPEGFFIFDVSTQINSLKYFDNSSETDSYEDFSYWRYSEYKKDKQFQINRFRIKDKINKKVYIEEHIQKIYSINDIEKIISKTKFNLLYKLEGFTFNEGSENSDRVHFVLRK